MKQILVIEDDPEIRELISSQLRREQYNVDEADSGEVGLKLLKSKKYDLLIVDWMLPGLEGVEICRVLRSQAIESPQNIHWTPILMLTAKVEINDIVRGLEAGADDYMTKPFDLNVLKARVRALLRRGSLVNEPVELPLKRIGSLSIDMKSHEVRCENEIIPLTLSEFKLLSALVHQQGRVLTRDQLIGEVQGSGVAVIDRTVDTHVFGLRKKLGSCATLIETVRGVGYRIATDLE